jgi:putative transposase
MANTYHQIHIQGIFAVKNRSGLIQREWKDELYKYITGIIQTHNHKLLAINGIPDHLHIFFGMRPTQSLSDLMQDVKGSSSKWINEKNSLKRNLNGRKVLAHFLTVNHRFQKLLNTFATRRLTIVK